MTGIWPPGLAQDRAGPGGQIPVTGRYNEIVEKNKLFGSAAVGIHAKRFADRKKNQAGTRRASMRATGLLLAVRQLRRGAACMTHQEFRTIMEGRGANPK